MHFEPTSVVHHHFPPSVASLSSSFYFSFMADCFCLGNLGIVGICVVASILELSRPGASETITSKLIDSAGFVAVIHSMNSSWASMV